MDVFWQIITYCLIIAVGFLFKKRGMVTEEVGRGLSTLILYFTLPCAVIANFEGVYLDSRYLIIFILGMVGNMLHDGIGYLISRKKSKNDIRFWMLCMSGYNIGCFALPFASIFLGPSGFVACCLFDAGNAFFCTGLNLTLMQLGIKENVGVKPKKLILDLLSKPVFTAYIFLVTFSLLKIPFPARVYSVTASIGKANATMSMLMIGILLNVSFDKEYTSSIGIMALTRGGVAILLSAIILCCSFIPMEMRKGMALISFAPISAATTAYLAQFKCRPNQAAFLSTMSILFSMAAMITIGLVL